MNLFGLAVTHQHRVPAAQMNANLESLSSLLSTAEPVRKPVHSKSPTNKSKNTNDIWDTDELDNVVEIDTDPRPAPE